jgi:hypothetical protein
MKDSNKLFKKLGIIGIGLCAACCLLPIIGVVFGIGAVAFLTGVLEWAGSVALIGTVAFFMVYSFRRRRASSCDIRCGRNEEKMVR